MATPDFGTIRDVSDTAFWVAHYRAEESRRMAPLFRDAMAASLAGERGPAITRSLKKGRTSGWVMVTRTVILDHLLVRLLSNGFDMVLNLAAGLDTRPYRLPLAPDLRWVEVDRAPLLDYKEQVLAGTQPRCQRSVIAADLSDAATRQRVLREATEGAEQVLVLSEGLLPYLADADVQALARDLHAVPAVHTWLFDVMNKEGLDRVNRWWQQSLKDAPMRFCLENAGEYFAPMGWREQAWYDTFREAQRIRRTPWVVNLGLALMQYAPARRRASFSRSTGVAHLQRA